MAKIAFWITAGPDLKEKALAGVVLAGRLKKNRRQDVEVYFFGPGVALAGQAAQDPQLKEIFTQLFDSQAPVGVCPFNAEQYGVKDLLASNGYRMEPAGEALVRLVEQGYQVIGY
ncbi:MAG: DsrE family protein [Firmicutes bacterium]|nr:DsrE family protein [Bacillota bacterium]